MSWTLVVCIAIACFATGVVAGSWLTFYALFDLKMRIDDALAEKGK